MIGLDNLGVIAKGKTGEFIAKPGNPLADTSVTSQADFVMKKGAIYKGDSLLWTKATSEI